MLTPVSSLLFKLYNLKRLELPNLVAWEDDVSLFSSACRATRDIVLKDVLLIESDGGDLTKNPTIVRGLVLHLADPSLTPGHIEAIRSRCGIECLPMLL